MTNDSYDCQMNKLWLQNLTLKMSNKFISYKVTYLKYATRNKIYKQGNETKKRKNPTGSLYIYIKSCFSLAGASYNHLTSVGAKLD